MLTPSQRTGRREIKVGPCGLASSTRGADITVFEPGQTIEIVIDEYINHPGHFRIAFDADGQDFETPICLENCDSGPDPVFAEDATGLVLRDMIPDTNGGESRYAITLPDVECENCTLQMIQVMYDKRPYTRSGNDIYFTCADLALRAVGSDAGPVVDAGTDAGAVDAATADAAAMSTDSGARDAGIGGAGGGCGCGTTPASSGAIWIALSLLGFARREEN